MMKRFVFKPILMAIQSVQHVFIFATRTRPFAVSASFFPIFASFFALPALLFVIPAKAGIHCLRYVPNARFPSCYGGNGDNRRNGFTLLEITITIILSAILGTILFQFMGSGLTRSAESVIMVQDGFDTLSVMERIMADYENLIESNSSDPLGTLKNDIDSGEYGTYSATTDWIKFNGTNEEEDTSADPHILKVTISIGEQSVTSLFTDTRS